MESKYLKEDRLLILMLEQDIDDCESQKLRIAADKEIERYLPNKTIFDFTNVTFMDSAGIGLLIGRYKFAKMLGRRSRSCKSHSKRRKNI